MKLYCELSESQHTLLWKLLPLLRCIKTNAHIIHLDQEPISGTFGLSCAVFPATESNVLDIDINPGALWNIRKRSIVEKVEWNRSFAHYPQYFLIGGQYTGT